MRWLFNPDRIGELIKEERARKIAIAILQYANRDVFLVLIYGWLIFLFATFSFLFVARLALTIPLWR